ncbi:MAG: hypothetical protein AAF517_26815 [Planctomycetota bacterium]
MRRNTGRDNLPEARDAGGLLLEVVIYTAVLLILSAPLATVMTSSTRAVTEHAVINVLAERNRVALSTLYDEIRVAIASSVDVPSDQVLRFSEPTDSSTSESVLGTSWEFGFDTDADGFHILQRTNLDTGDKSTVCIGINQELTKFERVGNAVAVTLVTEGEIEPGGAVHQVERYMIVTPRN